MHPDVKTFGLSILGGIAGYLGLFGGLALVSVRSSNTHGKSMEVVTTGIFANRVARSHDWTKCPRRAQCGRRGGRMVATLQI